MVVGREVGDVVAVAVGTGVCVSVTAGIGVGVADALPSQADRKYAKSTINRSVNFIRTQLYTQAV